MKLEPRKPRTPFDFGQAVGAMFTTPDGKAFAWRLMFWTTAAMAVVTLVLLPFILPHYVPLMEYNAANMQAIMAGQTPPDPDMDVVLGSLSKMWLPALVMMLLFWGAYAAGEAALHRKVLLGQENAKRPLRFGKDQLRVMLAQLGVWAVFFLVYIGGIIAISLGAVIPGLGVVVVILGVLAMIFYIVNLPIRLAPAAALSIYNDRAHLLAARHITKHRFWPLFGAYVVVFIGGYILIYTVMLAVIILVTGDSKFLITMYGMSDQSPGEAFAAAGERLKNPFFMLIGVLGVIAYSAAYAFWLLSMAGIGAYAVKWWQQDDPIAPFD